MTEVLSQQITSIFPKSANRKMVNALKEVARNQGWRKLAFTITINSEETQVIVSLLKVNQQIIMFLLFNTMKRHLNMFFIMQMIIGYMINPSSLEVRFLYLLLVGHMNLR